METPRTDAVRSGMALSTLAYASAAGLAAWLLAARKRFGKHPYPKPFDHGVPFAIGKRPVWPIAPNSRHRKLYVVSYKDVDGERHGSPSRSFKANRGERNHVGIDLYANAGDVVVAPEDGTIVGHQNFLHGTRAVLIQLDSGPVVLLGEVDKGGLKEFGLRVGSRVKKEQPVTRVGVLGGGGHMLHTETYRKGTTKNKRWYKNRDRPPEILDPTDFLLQAKANSSK